MRSEAKEIIGSPQTAALYYWGGHCTNKILGNDDDEFFYWEKDTTTKKAISTNVEWDSGRGSDVWKKESTGFSHRRQRTPWKRKPRTFFRLHDDDDVDNHWLTCPRLTPASSDEEEEEVEEEKAQHTQANEQPIPETGTIEPFAIDNSIPLLKSSVESFSGSDFVNNDFDAIPIVDMSLSPDKYSRQIGRACRTAGFFYVINHGVPDSIVSKLAKHSEHFFALDLSEKMRVSSSGTKGGLRGYFGLGMEDLDGKDGTRDLLQDESSLGSKTECPTTKGDYKEGYDCGREVGGKDDPYECFFGKNKWPIEPSDDNADDGATGRELSGFRVTLLEYQKELLILADKLLAAFASSLMDSPQRHPNTEISPDFFLVRSRNPMCTLRLLHYPPNDGSSSTAGCGAHTDYGLFTILKQDDVGGLQVRNRSNKWIDAKPLPGSFVINVGDMMSLWTGGEYSSTVHRVKSPSRCTGHRYSMPFFFNPDHDAVVEPIFSPFVEIRKDGGLCKLPKTASEILTERYDGTFKKVEAEETEPSG